MPDTLFRYPGAQPFRDDEFARRTFFGRDAVAVGLTNQILANRLMVVYAKSGVGKTSLLNAGVAQRLRDTNTIPLFVRVNDAHRDLLSSVMETVGEEAKRQEMEYVEGDKASLWSFVKTVQFWHGDILMTPALIFDQFEELFTLQSEEVRDKFLSELSYMVRGVPPPLRTNVSISDAPPRMHVVFSLREDFLGLLEEASDRIPQIMDNRFRLMPLDRTAAADAITLPAEIEFPNVATKPFRLGPEVVPSILDYLTRSTAGGHTTSKRYVEPFQLQLICQRIEQTVAAKQKASGEGAEFNLNDLGGEAALSATLTSFYEDAIYSLPRRRLRRGARRMCEELLISPQGRRLSLEEHELQDQLKLPSEALVQLVERRLLRTDRRADSTYYELSHDALVQPILTRSRTQALALGCLTFAGGAISLFWALACALCAIILPIAIYFGAFNELRGDKWFLLAGLPFYLLLAVGLGYVGRKWLKSAMRTQRRYRRRTSV